jgi:predicted methyltransferase
MLGRGREMKKGVQRALIEVGFIVFLFYANLLMR